MEKTQENDCSLQAYSLLMDCFEEVWHFLTSCENLAFSDQMADAAADDLNAVIQCLKEMAHLANSTTLKPFRKANPYPAVLGDWSYASYYELTYETIWKMYLELLSKTNLQSCRDLSFLRSVQGFEKAVVSAIPFPPQEIREHKDEFCSIAASYKKLSSPLLAMHLFKELARATKLDSLPEPEAGEFRSWNRARDEWMYKCRQKGATIAQIKEKLRVERPEWEQLATPQGVTLAMRRYARRFNLDWPIKVAKQ